MMEPFFEAVRDLLLPCSLTLVIPGVSAALATKRDPLPVAAAGFVGIAAVGWLRSTGQVGGAPEGLIAFALGLLTVIAFGALWFDETGTGQRVTAGLVIGVTSAAIWAPCVGEELGVILNNGPDNPFGVLVPFVLFAAGLALPSVGVALSRIGFNLPKALTRAVSMIGTAIGVVIGLLLATGLYSEVVTRLAIASV